MTKHRSNGDLEGPKGVEKGAPSRKRLTLNVCDSLRQEIRKKLPD